VEEARGHFAEAVRIRPGFANARFNLGLALETLGRLDEAAAQYEEAARLDPSDPAAAARLARIRGAKTTTPRLP
jgi:Flp pilus assembly protein TadD